MTTEKGGAPKGKPKNAKHKREIAAQNILARLEKNAAGTLKTPEGERIEMSPSQIKAAEIYLSKTVPSLSAVEQTNINEADNLTQDQLMATLKGMLDNPATKRMLKLLLEDDNKLETVQKRA